MVRRLLPAFAAAVGVAGVGLAQNQPRPTEVRPPVAEARPHDVVSPHGTRNDPYYWLRDDTRSRPEVLDYLRAENAYYEAMTASFRGLTEKLSGEIIGRLKQDDSSVPFKHRDYVYYTRYDAAKEYPIYARRPVGSDREQVLLDANQEAAGKGYYQVGGRAVSAQQDVLAFLEDTAGRRQYTLRFRHIATGKDQDERIPGLTAAVAWANDNKTVYYVENDPVTLLSTRVKKHVLGTDPKTDPVVYEERDTSFYLSVHKTGDDRFVAIALRSTVASECRVIDADDPAAAIRVLAPRQRDVLYDADHIGARWVIRTDWDAPNHRLMTVPDAGIGDRGSWKDLLPYDPNVFLEGFALFHGYLAINERSEGLLRIRVVPWGAPEKGFHIRSEEPAYAEDFSVNAEQDSEWLRYTHTSLTTPTSVYEVNMRSGERRLLKRQPVLGGYAPEFDLTLVSLLDRGFVYAIAHVRGGQEMGRAWYDDGRLLKKKNTFTDFVDVTDFLVRQGYAAKDKAFAMGASAGGLLMGAVANMAPERYRAIIAHVPYVDAVTTMLDETIPLVSNEFDEWGDPKQKVYYDCLLSYSPYDNVKPQAYPAMLVTTGLHDSQVQYYEPTKWVARLRAMKTDRNPLLLKINMSAGHGGRSGRFERLKQTAEEYAFILDGLGIGQ